MKISVIIPVHNAANTLKWAVQSALSADRVILVDDGSEDTSADLVRHLASTYDKVVKVDTGSPLPGGVCHARNLAIARADDDSLIIPLDADDILLPNAVHSYAGAWARGGCVYGGWVELDVVNNRRRDVMPLVPEAIERQDIARGICFHKADWLRAGGYDPAFNLGGEDYAFMLALVRSGVALIRLPQLLYQYTVGAHSRKDNARGRWPCVQSLIEEKYGRIRESHPTI